MAAARSMAAAAETSTDMVPPIVTRNKHRPLARRRRLTIRGTGRHHSLRCPASGDGSGTGIIGFAPASELVLGTGHAPRSPGLQAINMGELARGPVSRAPILSCAIRNSSDE